MRRPLAIALSAAALIFGAGCNADTQPATNVESSTATINAIVDCAAGDQGTYWWEYRKVGDTAWTQAYPGSATAPVPFNCGSSVSGQAIKKDLGTPPLAPATTYQFRICAHVTQLAGQPNDFTRCADSDRDRTEPDDNYDTFTTKAPPPPAYGPLNWPTRFYSDASPFNRRLPASPATAANSQEIVNRWLSWNPLTHPNGSIAAGDTDWGTSYYFAQLSDPVYQIHCVKYGCPQIEGAQIHIPAQAKPPKTPSSAGGDPNVDVIQPDGTEYSLYELQTVPLPAAGGPITVSSGGKGNAFTGTGLNYNPADAGHIGYAAGMIRADELKAGRIDHAINIVVRCTNGSYVYPAESPDARACSQLPTPETNVNAPANGEHFYLDMTAAEIDALAIPAWKRTIMHAMAEYGTYVRDTGGGLFVAVANPLSWTVFGYTDPLTDYAKSIGIPPYVQSADGETVYVMKFGNDVPVNWANEFKVAQPCVAQGTC